MRVLKKVLIVLGSLLVLLILANYGVSYYISKKLPEIINREKGFPYNISYENLDVNILTGSLTAHKVYVAPKDSTGTQVQEGAFAQIKSIDVQHLQLLTLLRKNKINVNKIILNQPRVILYARKKKYNVEDDFSKPFKKTVNTGSVEVVDGNFTMLDPKERISLKAANIDFKIENIRVDSATVKKDIPIRYSDYYFKCDSVFYRMDQFYNVTANSVANTDTSMVISNFKLIPKYGRASFTKAVALEKDLFTITAKRISLPAIDWGYLNDVLYVHVPKMTLDNVNANIYRNKLPKDDPSRRKMYSEMLRGVNFDLKADKILLRNSNIVYEEQNDWTRPPAKVTFSKFYATITNVYSPLNKKKFPNTVVDAQCMFMKTTPLKATWTFNTMNQNDAFTFKGSMQGISTEQMNVISNPLLRVKTEGSIKYINFTINGNKDNGTGKFGINYEDLKVAVMEKDGKEKHGVISAIGNLFIKNDTDDKVKQTDIEVTRAKDRSFFNFLWLCLQDGLRKAILPKLVEKALPPVRPPKPKKKK